MTEWMKARKKPLEIEYRKVEPNAYDARFGDIEVVNTREGKLIATPEHDFVIKGVEGELYPIKKSIFEKTYEVL